MFHLATILKPPRGQTLGAWTSLKNPQKNAKMMVCPCVIMITMTLCLFTQNPLNVTPLVNMMHMISGVFYMQSLRLFFFFFPSVKVQGFPSYELCLQLTTLPLYLVLQLHYILITQLSFGGKKIQNNWQESTKSLLSSLFLWFVIL